MPSNSAVPLVKTFGCRLNAWESEVIRQHASTAENLVVVNTCAVTHAAEKQARQWIRKIRRSKPDATIIATGCAVQINPEAWAGLDGVDGVVGNHEKMQAATWQEVGKQSRISDIMQARSLAPHLLAGFDQRSRAFLQIQQGCDHRCTFCIIPYGRGGNRSLAEAQVIASCRHMVAHGVAEIVLTGVDISSWGKDLAGKPSLGELVKNLLSQVPDLPRLRLSSLDPAEIGKDEALLEALGGEGRLMPHLHLSLQHGDGLILKRMKRRHSPEMVAGLVARLRAMRSDIVFGADVMCGFPTESEAAHQTSMRRMQKWGMAWLHVFPFSARAGTPAARMPQLPSATIKRRAEEMRGVAVGLARQQLDRMLGCDDEIVMETGGIAHSRQFARLAILPGAEAQPGRIYSVRIRQRLGDVLQAEILA